MDNFLHGRPARADARETLRRATYLRIFAVLPQSSMLHQRRLPFLLVSTKRKRQAPALLHACDGTGPHEVDSSLDDRP